MRVPLLLLTLLLQAPQPQLTPPARKSSVEGVVLSAGTGEPIEDAVVTLAKAAAENEAVEVSAATDSQGRFAFKDLDVATYRLVFESSGYVSQEYGQRVSRGKGTPIHLAEGQSLKSVVIRLIPTGSVSGRILDDNKQPVAGVPVRLMRFSYNEQGQKMLRPSGSARTDDRGEYRLYFVTPGRYYLNAGVASSPRSCWEFNAGPNEVQEIYANAYYPGVAELKFASVVEVQAAAEMRGVDLTLVRAQRYKVRGRIIDSTTGQPPIYAELSLSGDYSSSCGLGYKSTLQNGIFEFRDVAPGSHLLAATIGPGERQAGPVPVVVVNGDIDGIVLTLSPGVTVSGRVRIEGLDSLAELTKEDYGPGVGLSGARSGGHARLKADGTFQIDNVLPGEYDVYAWPKPSSTAYIREARFGLVDVLSEPLHIAGPESRMLDILLSSKHGAVDGTATDPFGPVPGAQLVLVPEKSRRRRELFKAVTADQNGRFSIADVVPGDYRLFAWEAIEPYSWFDPEVLAPYESRARSIHVGELSKQSIEVRTMAITP